MSTRKIKALEALVERGATEGERKAARQALAKERAKHSQPAHEQRPHNPFTYSAPFTPPRSAFDDWIRTVVNARGRFHTRVDPPRSGVRGKRFDFIIMDDVVDTDDTVTVQPPPKSWPDAVAVFAHPTETGRALLEVGTRSEMYERFREGKPVTVRWRSHVWRTEGFAGTFEDRDVYPPRFYLTINTGRMERLD